MSEGMRAQPVVTALMAYATWLSYKCPCKRTLSCHLNEFFLTVGVATSLVAYENGALSLL